MMEHKNIQASTLGSNNLLAFIGGFIGAMTNYIASIHALLNVQMDELIIFTIHSLIGGAIMVGVKVFSDWLLEKIKNPTKKKTDTTKMDE